MQNYSSPVNIRLLKAAGLFNQNFSAASYEDNSINKKLNSMQADFFVASLCCEKEPHKEIAAALDILNQIERNIKEHRSMSAEFADFEKCYDYKDQEVAKKHELYAESKISHFMTFADVAAM